MNWLRLVPKSLKQSLLLQGLEAAFAELDAQHLGTLLNEAMDRKVGTDVSNPIQKRLATWLRDIATEVER